MNDPNPNNKYDEFINQLLYTSQDERLKDVIRNDYQSLKKVLELYDEWKVSNVWDDEDLLNEPPGCFQC